MRFVGGWRRGAAAIAALIALLAVASPAAAAVADEPAPSVEVAGVPATPEQLAKPLEVSFKPPAGEEPGVLQLPLVAREAGPLDAHFVESKSGKEVAIEPAAKVDEKKLVISGELPEKDLAVGQLFVLRLVFTPPKAEPEALGGILEVGIKGALPLTRTVTVATQKKGWAPAQKKVEIVSTRPFPFLPASAPSREIGVTPEDSAQALPKEDFATRYLAFSSWGNATVTVGRPHEVGKGQRAKIAVTGVSGVGTATTIVDLGGAAKPSQELEVVVQVGDAIWFPLIVIILGAFLGRLVPGAWDIWRQGELTSTQLWEAIRKYKQQRGLGDPPPGLPAGPPDGSPPDQSPPDEGPADHLEPLDEMLPGLEATARKLELVLSASTLADEADAAKAAVDQLEGWSAVHKALRALAKEVDEAKLDLAAISGVARRPLLDGEDLLERTFEVSADLARSERWAKAISLQAEALGLYAAIQAAAEIPGEPDDPDWQQLPVEALRVYVAAGPAMTRSAKKGELMVETLRQIRGWQPDRPQAATFGFLPLDPEQLAAITGAAPPGEPATSLFDLLRPQGGRSKAEVMERVRRGDWIVFTFALVLSALVYLPTVYSSGPFGTVLQYLTAFAAGAGTQVAVNVALPITRSMKPGSGEAAGGTPAAATS
jgi:hypothetical protein